MAFAQSALIQAVGTCFHPSSFTGWGAVVMEALKVLILSRVALALSSCYVSILFVILTYRLHCFQRHHLKDAVDFNECCTSIGLDDPGFNGQFSRLFDLCLTSTFCYPPIMHR
jgi:hypothetical protein